MKGGSAEDIVAATAKALKIFCTRLFLPPRMGKALAPQGGFDRDLVSAREEDHQHLDDGLSSCRAAG